jgi:hypothetical protein
MTQHIRQQTHFPQTSLQFLMLLLMLTATGASSTTFKQQDKWLASDGAANDLFGYSVALSGNTAVIGAHQVDTDRGEDVGAVYVYTQQNGCWAPEARLIASDGAAKDMFGGMTAIDGDTLVVGVIRSDGAQSAEDSGAAYVFQRWQGQWHEQAKLTAADAAAGDGLGWGVDIAGNTVVIGAPRDDDQGTDSGAVYVFEFTRDHWTQSAKLLPDDGAAGDVFGISVALSADTLLVGADLNDETAPDAGAAYVFIRQDGHWQQQAKLVANDGESKDIFGVRVALEGDVALISARRDDLTGVGTDAGSAYVFTRQGTTWTQSQKLTAPDGQADDRFGRSLDLSGDALLIGAMLNDATAKDSGAAYLFHKTATEWSYVRKLTASDAASQDMFGWAVALDGADALIAANGQDDRGAQAGAVYLFTGEDKEHNCADK